MRPEEMRTAADDLWGFALKVYEQTGVPEACLELQDAFGADVPVMLCALWMAKRGLELDDAGMAMLDEAVRPWHAEVVMELRALRRRLKEGPHPAPSQRTDKLRNMVKAAELDAERIELTTLAELVKAPVNEDRNVSFAGNLAVAMRHYAGKQQFRDEAVSHLIGAAQRVD